MDNLHMMAFFLLGFSRLAHGQPLVLAEQLPSRSLHVYPKQPPLISACGSAQQPLVMHLGPHPSCKWQLHKALVGVSLATGDPRPNCRPQLLHVNPQANVLKAAQGAPLITLLSNPPQGSVVSLSVAPLR
ncbi:hypothetical protein GOP47_0024079 [Adiantum capillus-veneris]|uniref:Uncharacterized protein n=1 Tax=Adiantum capillus-veneris TaxID=13818 RepID=A0A9D4U6U7_ADICA|nr:hypothetical protein GOP47_0024079 [Adiantum capillus-veneris]